MPTDPDQLFRLSPFVKIQPAQAVYDQAKWQDQWILKNERNGRHFTANSTISRFLLLFQQPASLTDVFVHLQLSEEAKHLTVRKQLTGFLLQMLEQNILVRNEEWRPPVRVQCSDQLLVLEEEYQVEEVFQQFPSHFVCRVKPITEGTNSVIKGLHLHNLPLKNRAEAISKFENEFSILSQVGHHPQICTCLAFDPVRYRALLPFYPGVTLEERLRSQPLESHEAWTLWKQIVHIIAFLHQEGISHGDVHFDNLIYAPDGQLVLIDFTNAVQLDHPPDHVNQGVKLPLIPPERIDNDSLQFNPNWISTARAEVYQLGILAYYLLYHHYPFSGSKWQEVASGILHQKIAWPVINSSGQTIEKHWIAVLQKCLSRKAEDRWKDAQAVVKQVGPA